MKITIAYTPQEVDTVMKVMKFVETSLPEHRTRYNTKGEFRHLYVTTKQKPSCNKKDKT